MTPLEIADAADLVVAGALGRSTGQGRRRQPGDPTDSCRSLLDQIQSRLERFADGDQAALAPGPTVNRVFSRLVELVTTSLDPRDTAGDSHRFAMSDGHWAVTRAACRLIDNDPGLSDRSGQLRRAAALAEGAMERHYARLITATAAGRPVPAPTQAAGVGVGSTEALTRLRIALQPFPYAHNYEQLVGAEVAALGSAGTGTRLVFCGAGPLPLTGVWWHHFTGGGVTLVEIDPAAAETATAFLDGLSRLRVLDRDAFEILVADAGAIDLGPGTVLTASLLGADAVLRVGAGRAIRAEVGPLLVRSATGLVARLAYERIDIPRLTALGARHRATVAPSRVIGWEPDLPPDIGIRLDGPVPVHTAPPEVLNLTEIISFDLPPAIERAAP